MSTYFVCIRVDLSLNDRQDETFIVFCDRDPAAAVHYQLIPKAHIRTLSFT